VRADERLRTYDPALAERLDALRHAFEADKAFPDVVAVWEAIKLVTAKNKNLSERGAEPYPLPDWISSYLLRSADKISRLSLGIHPEDDRPLALMNVGEVGCLRKVRQADRDRDVRATSVGTAFGFVRKGKSAFQHHDRAERDSQYLGIYDDPSLDDEKPVQREVRRAVLMAMMKNEHIGSEAAKNRLSKARASRRNSGAS
jgi:hypothetical protein